MKRVLTINKFGLLALDSSVGVILKSKIENRLAPDTRVFLSENL